MPTIEWRRVSSFAKAPGLHTKATHSLGLRTIDKEGPRDLGPLGSQILVHQVPSFPISNQLLVLFYPLLSPSQQPASLEGPSGSPGPTTSLTKHRGPELDKGLSRSAQEYWDGCGCGALPDLGSPGQSPSPTPSNHMLCCM